MPMSMYFSHNFNYGPLRVSYSSSDSCRDVMISSTRSQIYNAWSAQRDADRVALAGNYNSITPIVIYRGEMNGTFSFALPNGLKVDDALAVCRQVVESYSGDNEDRVTLEIVNQGADGARIIGAKFWFHFKGNQRAFAAMWWCSLLIRLMVRNHQRGLRLNYHFDVLSIIEASDQHDDYSWNSAGDKSNHVRMWNDHLAGTEPQVWRWLVQNNGPISTKNNLEGTQRNHILPIEQNIFRHWKKTNYKFDRKFVSRSERILMEKRAAKAAEQVEEVQA